ncbi:MAG: tyrosine protein phosphatase, partial [Pseudomonadota bacterium]
RQAKTGILDHFIAAYKTYAAQTPIPFFDWVDTVYDRAALEAEFKANRAADLLVGGVMRRE